MADQIRLPAEGAVHVSEGENNTLVITVPVDNNPGETSEIVCKVFNGIMAVSRPPQAQTEFDFYVETHEAQFVAKMMRPKKGVWDHIKIVHHFKKDSRPMEWSMPGPFQIRLGVQPQHLAFTVRRGGEG